MINRIVFDELLVSEGEPWECKWVVGFFLKTSLFSEKALFWMEFPVSAGKLCMK